MELEQCCKVSHHSSRLSSRGAALPAAVLTVLCLALGFGATPTAYAALIVYEGFDYRAGDALMGKNGGMGWAWSVWRWACPFDRVWSVRWRPGPDAVGVPGPSRPAGRRS